MAQSIHDMDRESQKQALQEVQNMIGTVGWRLFLNEIAQEIEVIKESLLAAHKEQVPFHQGRADQCAQILGFEDMVENVLTALEMEVDDASL
jgi:hypothetical protein